MLCTLAFQIWQLDIKAYRSVNTAVHGDLNTAVNVMFIYHSDLKRQLVYLSEKDRCTTWIWKWVCHQHPRWTACISGDWFLVKIILNSLHVTTVKTCFHLCYLCDTYTEKNPHRLIEWLFFFDPWLHILYTSDQSLDWYYSPLYKASATRFFISWGSETELYTSY